jgi:adenosylcobyric acid synthase
VVASTVMIQGTTSDAGKSTLVTALCRVFARQGVAVAPFKPQNMSLNSAVTSCGGEIGRAQAVQAQAANVELSVHFNPVLLKPQSDTSAQVIIQGQAMSAMGAQDYQSYKAKAAGAVYQSHELLSQQYEKIIVEGAGSPAEINLRAGDIANMGFAEQVDCPVILIADIDKGGVFAHIVGTLALLSESEQERVVGFVINRFRGDIKLLESGLTWLEQYTNKPVLGVLPYVHGLHIAAEDAVNTEQQVQSAKFKIVVPVTPQMSNHNDFDALRVNPEIDLEFVYACEFREVRLPPADLIILAGSKCVRQDFDFIIAQNWHLDIKKHLRFGGKVFGICGGFQMLGETIADPHGIEGEKGQQSGLALLPIHTEITEHKTLINQTALMTLNGEQIEVTGYEIHMGQTTTPGGHRALLTINNQPQGLIADDEQVAGSYLHGIFDCGNSHKLLANWCDININSQPDLHSLQEQAINKLADVTEQHLDIKKIESLLSSWRN